MILAPSLNISFNRYERRYVCGATPAKQNNYSYFSPGFQDTLQSFKLLIDAFFKGSKSYSENVNIKVLIKKPRK
jgi:hypothetical protein